MAKTPVYLRGPNAVDVETNPKPSTTPDPNTYPRINTCCPCMECLNSCIRQQESNPPYDTQPTDNPEYDGCNAPATDGGTDCGPYQIDPANYVQDICESIDGECVPCDECLSGNGYDGGSDSCCDEPGPCTPGWADLLCQSCPNDDFPDAGACCAEKFRRSQRLMDCYRRRWTRNNDCQGTGPTIHPTDPDAGPCFTCQDLARMHQGGFCAHREPTPKNNTYWNGVKACMARDCGFVSTESGEACADVEVNKRKRTETNQTRYYERWKIMNPKDP